jgi:cytochrome c biogenesis protein ResB
MQALVIVLTGAAATALFAILGFIVKELIGIRGTLTSVHEQVLPENAPSLSYTVQLHTTQLAVLESHFPASR